MLGYLRGAWTIIKVFVFLCLFFLAVAYVIPVTLVILMIIVGIGMEYGFEVLAFGILIAVLAIYTVIKIFGGIYGVYRKLKSLLSSLLKSIFGKKENRQK